MIDKIAEILRDAKISVKGNILSGPEILILAQKNLDSLWTTIVEGDDSTLPGKVDIAGLDNTKWYLVEYQHLGALSVDIAWYGRKINDKNKEIRFHFPSGALLKGTVLRQWMAYFPPKLPSSLDKDYNVVWGMEVI